MAKPYHRLTPEQRRRLVDALRESERRPPAGPARRSAPIGSPGGALAANLATWPLRLRLGAWVAASLVGYLAFRFLLTTAAPHSDLFGVLALAILAAVATFFSPCCLMLLPGLLGFLHAQVGAAQRPRAAYGLPLAAAGGTVAFLALLGLALWAMVRPLSDLPLFASPLPGPWTRALWGIVASSLMVLGLLEILRTRVPGLDLGRPPGTRHEPYGTAFLYGFGYTAVSALLAASLIAGLVEVGGRTGPGWAAAGLLAYGATLVGLFLVAAAASRPGAAPRPAGLGTRARVASGVLQVSSGMMLGLLTLFTADFYRWFVPT